MVKDNLSTSERGHQVPNAEDIRHVVSAAARIPDLTERLNEQRRITRLYPHAAVAWFNLASDLAHAGLINECREAALRAVHLDPLIREQLPDGVKKILIASQPTVSAVPLGRGSAMPIGDQRGWDLDDLNGRILEKWCIGRLLGEGTFGRVFEAEHVDVPGHRAAVKILRQSAAARMENQQRFINEMSVASRSQHENVVQIFDGGITDEGVCYAAMELLQGTTLTVALGNGPITVDRALHMAIQVASALQAVHKLGVVHRDLKPDNIFLTPRPSDPEFVKVLDFGIAKLRGLDAPMMTTFGTAIGTPGYMAPEQWRAEQDIDGRADIYGLGVILYQSLAGRLPFFGATTFEFQQAHLTQEVPRFTPSTPLPVELDSLVVSMLAKARADRPQDMSEVRTRLLAIRDAIRRTHTDAVLPSPPANRSPIWLIGAAALAVVVAVAFWLKHEANAHDRVAESGAEQAYRAANGAWNSGFFDAYLTAFTEPVECFFNLSTFPIARMREHLVPDPNVRPLSVIIDRIVYVRSSPTEVIFWVVSHRGGLSDHEADRTGVVMRMVGDRWRIVTLADRDAHNCFPEINGFADP